MERLTVEIGPSRYYCALCLLVHALAFVALWFSGLAWYFVGGIGLALAASLAHHLYRYGLLAEDISVVALDCEHGMWQVKLSKLGWLAVSIDRRVTVMRHLVVMHFRDRSGRRFPVALLPDSTSRESFRRTKVLLRLGT